MIFIYRVHAIERMFQRDILETDVEDVIKNGEIIESYLNDKPYPSYLSCKEVDGRMVHVVFAEDEEANAIVITVYKPTLKKWQNDFKTRREKR